MCYVPEIRYPCCLTHWREASDPFLPILELCPAALIAQSPSPFPSTTTATTIPSWQTATNTTYPQQARSPSHWQPTTTVTCPIRTLKRFPDLDLLSYPLNCPRCMPPVYENKLRAVDKTIEDARAVTRSLQTLSWASRGRALDAATRLRDEAQRLETSVQALIGTLEWAGDLRTGVGSWDATRGQAERNVCEAKRAAVDGFQSRLREAGEKYRERVAMAGCGRGEMYSGGQGQFGGLWADAGMR